VIRKWSYINNFFFQKSNLPLFNRFLLKIFRKNTRFKGYNQGITFFVRKLVVLQKRRSGWKLYSILTSSWVSFFLQNKKLVNFLQTKILYKYTVLYPYPRMLCPKLVSIGSIGSGLYSLNVSFLYKNLNTFFQLNNTYSHFFSKNAPRQATIKVKKYLTYTTSFNHLKNTHKLSKLGFTFTNTFFLKSFTPLLPTNYHTTPYWRIYNLDVSISPILVSVRMLHTYFILLYLNKPVVSKQKLK
jgi:hypothetical protein